MARKNNYPTPAEVWKAIERMSEEITRVGEEITRVDRQVSKVTKSVGELTNSWGMTIEGFAAPSTQKALRKEGFEIKGLFQRALRRDNGRTMEIDILLLGRRKKRDVVILVEVTNQLKAQDIDDLKDKVKRFLEFFPEYSGWNRVGIVCGVRVDQAVERYATHAGFYVMAPSGDAFIIKARPSICKL